MYYVYLIQSILKDFLYVGSTDNIKRRSNEHNQKKVLSTKSYAPFNLIYCEIYRSKKDALIRENKLKHHGSVIGHLKKRLKNSLRR